jgi:hypothetical protein
MKARAFQPEDAPALARISTRRFMASPGFIIRRNR